MGGILCCKKREDLARGIDDDSDDDLDVEELMQEAVGDEKGAIELSLSCKGLPDKDKFSRSDPFVICHRYVVGDEDNKTLLGRTEVKENTLTPMFLAPIMCPFSHLHVETMLLFEVYHEKSKELEFYEQPFMGEFRVLLKDLMETKGMEAVVGDLIDNRETQRNEGFGLNLALATDMLNVVGGGINKGLSGIKNVGDILTKGGRDEVKKPTIRIMTQHAKNTQEKIILTLSGKNLRRPKSRLGVRAAMANYFVLISRVQGNTVMPVAQSSVSRQFMTKDTLQKGINPDWEAMHIKTFRLCANDFHCPLLFQLFDMNYIDGSNHQLIGQARTTLAVLKSGAVRTLPMINEKKTGQSKYVNSGEINIEKCQLLTSYSFLDYVSRGFEINCSIAVDFSKSNGPKHLKSSLHFEAPDPRETPSPYARAIREACKIIGRYDKDQMFPCYGFGAMLGDNKVHNCFPISLDQNQVEIQGEDAIVEAYQACVGRILQVEPTCMAPVIRTVLDDCLDTARQNPSQPGYQFLVLLTDCDIDDVTETCDVLVECSYAPMSVLIIGMGDGGSGEEKFSKIKQLIDPKTELRSVITGKRQKRKVVSFVPWNNYSSKGTQEFARAALAKVPKHFLSWVEMSGYSLEKIHDEDLDFNKKAEDMNLKTNDNESSQGSQGVMGEVREIYGLKEDTDLNGQTGKVIGIRDGAYVLLLDGGRKRAVMPENLKPTHHASYSRPSYTPPQLSSLEHTESTIEKPYPLTLLDTGLRRASVSSKGSRPRSAAGRNPSFRDMVNPYGPATQNKTKFFGLENKRSVRELVDMKTKAVADEDYERAAELKREIDEMGGAEVASTATDDTTLEKRILTPPAPPLPAAKRVPYAPGSRVVLQNLTSSVELNGLPASVVQILSDDAVIIDIADSPFTASTGQRTVKTENIRLAPPNPPLPRYITSVRSTGLEV